MNGNFQKGLGVALKLIFIAVITMLAWFNLSAAIMAVAATILVVLWDKAKDIVEISFGVLKAKINRDLSEAEKLVGQLRDFSALQTKALFSAAIRTGRWAGEGDAWLFHHVKALEASLVEMGAKPDTIFAARQEFVRFTASDAGAMALGSGRVPTVKGKMLEKEWRAAIGKHGERDPDVLEAFLMEHDLMTEERQIRIDDMRWMLAEGDVRDEEMYLRSQKRVPWGQGDDY